MLQFPVRQPELCSHGPPMGRSALKQWILASVLGCLIATLAVGLALAAASALGERSPLVVGLGAAVMVFIALTVRLLSHTAQLAKTNRALRERNRDLQAATLAKSRFVANMSHEIRNPLNAVLGFSELMRNGRLGSVGRRQHESLEIIYASAQHVRTLLNDSLDLARIEAGHVRLEPAAVDPVAIASACATSLATVSGSRDVHIEVDPRRVGTVLLDPIRLRQVILNYLTNAIKFSRPGGRVTVVLRNREGRLELEVSDAGPGIPVDDQERVFDEFFQLPGRDRSGSGLGLAVTKMIVEAQGGEVGVRSQPGLGSTFFAKVPAPRVAEAEASWWPVATRARSPLASPAKRDYDLVGSR